LLAALFSDCPQLPDQSEYAEATIGLLRPRSSSITALDANVLPGTHLAYHSGMTARTSLHRLALAALLLLTPLLISATGAGLRTELEGILVDGLIPRDLVITYEAMHPFHGGAIVEVRGDGSALRRTRRRGDLQASIRQVELDRNDLLGLVGLIVEIEAWEQRVPERPPLPDEGRASLHIVLGDQQGGFWEWYNDMGEHDRLLRVSALMTELVPR